MFIKLAQCFISNYKAIFINSRIWHFGIDEDPPLVILQHLHPYYYSNIEARNATPIVRFPGLACLGIKPIMFMIAKPQA
jgi:hypothetical protein